MRKWQKSATFSTPEVDHCIFPSYVDRKIIKSLVELGILEEVKEHTDWVNSYVIMEKNSSNHHYQNHTIKRKMRTS